MNYECESIAFTKKRSLKAETAPRGSMRAPHEDPTTIVLNSAAKNPTVHGLHDPVTGTVTYVVHDGPGSPCAIVDSVLDYDPKSGRTRTASADRVIDYVREHRLRVDWLLETHVHVDHLTAARYLKNTLGGRIAIGRHITTVQHMFREVFDLEPDFRVDGSQFDVLFSDGDIFEVGELVVRVIAMPGDTPACIAYQAGDAVFVGDALFMPDVGTGRCDFPGGDARTLYASIHRLLSLPPETRLFMCHDYPPKGRSVVFETTVAAERANNIHVRDGISADQFEQVRTQRDATLDLPVLIIPAVQVNIRAGDLPPQQRNGISYLKIPLNVL